MKLCASLFTRCPDLNILEQNPDSKYQKKKKKRSRFESISRSKILSSM